MSLENLLEMDDLNGQSFSKAPPPKDLPRPLPRSSRIPKLSSGGSSGGGRGLKKDKAVVDEVLSMSSASEGASPRPPKRTVAFTTTTSSFDNNAFVTEEEVPDVKISKVTPPPGKRRPGQRKDSWFGDQESQRTALEDELNDNQESEDDVKSNATFTIENEEDPTPRLKKKPPIPHPKRRDVPKELPKVVTRRKMAAFGKKATAAEEEASGPKSSPTSSVDGEPPPVPSVSALKKSKGRDHLAVQMEPDEEEDGGDDDKGEGGGEGTEAGENADTASVSSAATKQTVKKSRFGKLFGLASSSSQLKNKTKSDSSENLDKAESEKISDSGASGGEKEKKTMANRWRKTFSRTMSKSLKEEEDEEEKEVDQLQEEKKETRILMPEEEEEKSEEDGDEEAVTSGQRKVKEEKQGKEGKGPKFKPFAKLIVSKNKEKKTEVAKERSTRDTDKKKKSDGERESPEEFSESSVSSAEEEDAKEEKEVEVKSRRKERKKEEITAMPCVDSASGKDLLFGVTLHSSDLLPLDPNVIHPVIKVTVMYQNGEYMRRSRGEGVEGGEGEKKRGKRHRRNKNGEDDKPPWTPNVADSVFPIMSQPCRARHSIPTFAPTWNELLVFEEPFKRFCLEGHQQQWRESEPVIFFEIMDFLPMTHLKLLASSSSTLFHGSEPGWYKIGWAFLKPVGANGVRNLNKKLRLQIYKPAKLSKKEKVPDLPEVYSWWKSGHREKIPCTLYVTPKGITPPEETRSASLRQLLSMRKEHLTQAILDSQLAPTKDGRRKGSSKKDPQDHLQDYPNWTRMEGQSCKPPDTLVATLPSSQIESLNIVISGNVHCTKFSPCGNYLASGLDTDELHVILLFKVPQWTLLKSLKGHHGLVYDLAWKMDSFEDDRRLLYLASCSADATVRIWEMGGGGDEKTVKVVKVLYHPSYVYCVKFHPTWENLVVTGCFDFVIRVWNVEGGAEDTLQEGGSSHKKGRKKGGGGSGGEASPIILLDKHSSFVNCLLIDPAGHHLFTGDGAACIFKWSCMSPSRKKSWRLEKDVKLHAGSVPVNSLNLHPSGTRLLVHLRDNYLKILDVVTLLPLQTFPGLHNERLQIRSCFSPCGNLVFSGSEDSTVCCWDADTGKILQLTTPKNHPHCVVTCVDYHPLDYYLAVGLAGTISEPSPILIYFYHQPGVKRGGGILANYPMLKKTALKMRQSLEKSRSQSSVQSEETGGGGGRGRSPKRGDSTEKFISIIHKLDTALYFAQQRNKQRQSEAVLSTCLSSKDPAAKEDPEENEIDGTREKFVKNKRALETSASAEVAPVARQRREKFRQLGANGGRSGQDRDIKSVSDSEQSYQLKIANRENEKRRYSLATEVDENIEERLPPKPLKRRSISLSQQQISVEDNNNKINVL